MEYKQQVNVPLILTIGIVSGIMVIVIVIGTQAWFQSQTDITTAELARQYPAGQQVHDNIEAQKANLAAYRLVDAKNHVYAIPIDQAIDVLVKSNGQIPATQPSGQ